MPPSAADEPWERTPSFSAPWQPSPELEALDAYQAEVAQEAAAGAGAGAPRLPSAPPSSPTHSRPCRCDTGAAAALSAAATAVWAADPLEAAPAHAGAAQQRRQLPRPAPSSASGAALGPAAERRREQERAPAAPAGQQPPAAATPREAFARLTADERRAELAGRRRVWEVGQLQLLDADLPYVEEEALNSSCCSCASGPPSPRGGDGDIDSGAEEGHGRGLPKPAVGPQALRRRLPGKLGPVQEEAEEGVGRGAAPAAPQQRPRTTDSAGSSAFASPQGSGREEQGGEAAAPGAGTRRGAAAAAAEPSSSDGKVAVLRTTSGSVTVGADGRVRVYTTSSSSPAGSCRGESAHGAGSFGGGSPRGALPTAAAADASAAQAPAALLLSQASLASLGGPGTPVQGCYGAGSGDAFVLPTSASRTSMDAAKSDGPLCT